LTLTPAAIDAAQRGLPRGFPQSLLDHVFEGMRKQAKVPAMPDA
jgi:hypothetical protein